MVAMSALHYKLGDTWPPLEAQLQDRDGPVDLSGATVRLRIRNQQTGDMLLDNVATVTTPVSGNVKYIPTTGQLSRLGNFNVEWHVAWADGAEATFPNSGYGLLVIQRPLVAPE
jgi:hypothetical protein